MEKLVRVKLKKWWWNFSPKHRECRAALEEYANSPEFQNKVRENVLYYADVDSTGKFVGSGELSKLN